MGEKEEQENEEEQEEESCRFLEFSGNAGKVVEDGGRSKEGRKNIIEVVVWTAPREIQNYIIISC